MTKLGLQKIIQLKESHEERQKDRDDPGMFRDPFCLAEMQGKGQRETWVELKSSVGSRILMAMCYKIKSSWRATEKTSVQENG